MYKKILVPLDGSQRAESILPHVESLAQVYDSELVLVRVIEPVPIVVGPAGFDGGIYHQQIDAQEKEVREYLDAKQIALTEAGFKVSYVIMQGIPVDSIIQIAREEHIDLVAMASHGRSNLGTMVFGSVAAGLLHRLDKPLFLIRAWG